MVRDSSGRRRRCGDGNEEANNTTSRLITIGPDLAVTAMTVPLTAGAGTAMTITATVKNQGGGSVGTSVTRFFLSSNAAWDASDAVLDGSLGVSPLSPGASVSGTATDAIPAGIAAGSYYVLAMADGDGAVTETQEANNTAARLLQMAATSWCRRSPHRRRQPRAAASRSPRRRRTMAPARSQRRRRGSMSPRTP